MRSLFLALALFSLIACASAFTSPSALQLRAPVGLRGANGNPRAALGLKMLTPGTAGAKVLVSSVATTGFLMADIIDDIGPNNLLWGGLAVTIVSIAAMLFILYQDGVR
eukprot:CAMPEP_0173418184 /NCGR_PEP_ID=MMETSP1357-20121228/396_1 /TAXON_ID=77926 /ORGANISM="Hemiselmis rufescens, Strain PCC563" /LENGTH=108 /DNA_ID=CAMNT_0014380633 /DNA_START=13 /DNA_END=339 /DNA_ORIENTATION=+